jgi:hypothetical protein
MKYFIANTRYCHALKLFKLLNFLDFEHYRQTGRTVTGLTYRALPKGPVPTTLLNEFKNGPGRDLAREVEVKQVRDGSTDELLRTEFKPLGTFQRRLFSKREVTIMERLVELFRDVRSEDMSRVSHDRGMPWGKVYQGGQGTGREIPYDLAIACDSLMADVQGLDQEELDARKELFAGIPGAP